MEKIQVGVIRTGRMEPGFSFNSIIEVQLSVSAKDPAGRCCAGPKGGGSSMTWSFTFTVVAKIYVFCALFLRKQSEGVQKGMLPPFGRRAASPRLVLITLLKS
jgi:hypothetical protein